MVVCASCGVESPDTFRFCPACASPLGGPAARDERKVVTVLFCDLVGSTSTAEQLDPEDVRALLSRYHARVRAELEHFGGTVEKFIGDAVVALFGAPVTHEDDPERALRAALSIRDWVAETGDLHVRIAVNTGEALVSLGARPSEGEGMASGDVVNTAARLQSAAPVDGILVGSQTYRATRHAIRYRPVERVVAKGKAEPVEAWEALEARARVGVDVAQPSPAPLVGRERELELLTAAFARACDERAAQLITLVGVPGIGKSRLLTELFGVLDRSERLITWRQGRSLPYGEGVSYWAFGEIVKAQAGILETDAPTEAAAKIVDTARGLIPDEADARWVESHLRPLAGLVTDGAAADRRSESFAAWRRFVEALAEQRPLVLVFEDLHWADDGLLDFVDHLVDWLADVPVLVVASARPELLARRSAWGGGKANSTTLSLAPLSDTETARLVHALLEQAVLPAEVQSALLERAGGNPLYAEEFVRMVGERGSPLDLPQSVQGIIAARLDALESEDKQLLQDAAVVGKVFWSGALAAVGGRDRFDVEERLHALERRELVRRERRSSVAGESEYAFRHVLVRDVAYSAIPRAARADRHGRAAEWIESLGRPDDHADLLAHHYLSALELARAAGVEAGVLTASAARALQRAGDRAFALNAFRSAVRFYEEALELGVTSDSRPHVLFRLGAALHRVGDDRRVEVLEEARDALLARGDKEAAADAVLLLAEAWWHRGQAEHAREHLQSAQDLVRDRGPSRTAARVLAETARRAMLADAHDEAIRVGGEALRMAEALGDVEVVVSALQSVGVARARRDFDGGVAELERAVEIAESENIPDAARAYNNLAAVIGDQSFERSYELTVRAKEVAERLGNDLVARYVEGNLIWTTYDLGRWDEALQAADAFIAKCEAGSPHYLEHTAHETRAKILLGRGDAEGALAAIARALELARPAADPQALLPSLAAAVHVYTELGRRAEARAALREMESFYRRGIPMSAVQAVLHAERLGLREELREAMASLPSLKSVVTARVLLDGDLLEAADALAEMGEVVNEAEARLLAAERLLQAGRRADADAQLARALEFFHSVRATRYIRQGEALLAATG